MNPKEAFIDCYEVQFFVNNLSGYNEVSFRSNWHWLAYKAYNLVLLAILAFNYLDCIYLLSRGLDDSGAKEYMIVVMMFLTTIVGSVKIFRLDFYRGEVRALHNSFYRDFAIENVTCRKRARATMKKAERNFATLSKWFYVSGTIILLVYILLLMFLPGERVLPYAFFEKDLESPYYEFVFVVQSVTFLLFMSNALSNDMISYGLLLRLGAQLEIVSESIDRFVECYPTVDYARHVGGYCDGGLCGEEESGGDEADEGEERSIRCDCGGMCGRTGRQVHVEVGCLDEETSRKTTAFLKCVVQRHQELLSKLDVIMGIFGLPIGLQLLCGTITFGLSASALFRQNFDIAIDIGMCGYALAGFADLFLCCYFGSYILERGEKIRRAFYSLPWYQMDMKSRKIILFILMRLRKKNGLVAAKVVNINLELFLQILKFTHSFIALIKEV